MNNKPVAWIDYLEHSDVYDLNVRGRGIPLYTHPVKEQDTDCQYCKQGCIRCDARKQLTDEEIMKTCIKHGIYDCISDSYIKDDGTNSLDEDLIRFARAILRKAQEK